VGVGGGGGGGVVGGKKKKKNWVGGALSQEGEER